MPTIDTSIDICMKYNSIPIVDDYPLSVGCRMTQFLILGAQSFQRMKDKQARSLPFLIDFKVVLSVVNLNKEHFYADEWCCISTVSHSRNYTGQGGVYVLM